MSYFLARRAWPLPKSSYEAYGRLIYEGVGGNEVRLHPARWRTR